MCLSNEEYENIWLRIKDRIGKWVIGYLLISIFLPVTILAYFGIDKAVDIKLDKKINEKLSSDDFAKEIVSATVNRLEKVKDSIQDAETKIIRLEEKTNKMSSFLANFPVTVEGQRLNISTETGGSFVLEYGGCVTLGKVKFNKTFPSTPAVFLSACSNPLIGNISNVKVADLSAEGFTIYSISKNDLYRKFSWLAISTDD